jgi:aerobic carbon-monoxide dehydrogenase small subunit
MTTDEHLITFRLNGVEQRARVASRLHLIDFLRERFQLSSPRIGCEHGVCGACTLRLDGQIVRGCLVLAAQIDGRSVETLEGLSASNEIRDLQEAFIERNAVQCGYCTAGMLICCADLLRDPRPRSREEIREHISGNYCRCTGYEAIVDAVEGVLGARLAKGGATHGR